jgi:hypothetical protein
MRQLPAWLIVFGFRRQQQQVVWSLQQVFAVSIAATSCSQLMSRNIKLSVTQLLATQVVTVHRQACAPTCCLSAGMLAILPAA